MPFGDENDARFGERDNRLDDDSQVLDISGFTASLIASQG